MTNIEQLTIGEARAIAALFQNVQPQPLNPCAPAGEAWIVIADRGFVWVGKVTTKGDFVEILNARNIRIWGTTKGLGELAGGPLSSTKLDDVGTVIVPMRAIIGFIKCTRDW